jgi:hypothetical protein
MTFEATAVGCCTTAAAIGPSGPMPPLGVATSVSPATIVGIDDGVGDGPDGPPGLPDGEVEVGLGDVAPVAGMLVDVAVSLAVPVAVGVSVSVGAVPVGVTVAVAAVDVSVGVAVDV